MTDPEHAAPGGLRPVTTDPTVTGVSQQDAPDTRHEGPFDTRHEGAFDTRHQGAFDTRDGGAFDTRDEGAFDTRRRRLLFRATHRGTYENDLIIGGFVKAHLTELTETDLDGLEAVMELPDTVLADWLTGRVPIPPMEEMPMAEMPMLRRMRNFIRDSRTR